MKTDQKKQDYKSPCSHTPMEGDPEYWGEESCEKCKYPMRPKYIRES